MWYQDFEYAISHWLQKAAEHVYGCVLCSPGCFSLFRGSSLMDDNVMRRYVVKADSPAEHVQYDQGTDSFPIVTALFSSLLFSCRCALSRQIVWSARLWVGEGIQIYVLLYEDHLHSHIRWDHFYYMVQRPTPVLIRLTTKLAVSHWLSLAVSLTGSPWQ